MAPPQFLIFLPVRNGGDQVMAAIASVQAQSHAGWRMMVLENASTDGTPARLAEVSDPRISIVPAAVPLGIHANWDRGRELLASSSPDTLVTFLGHDDVLKPDFLAQIAALAVAHPNATLYQTQFELIDDNDGILRPCRPVPDRESWTSLLADLCWNLRDSFGTGYVFRAKDYLSVGGIPDLPMLLYSDFLVFVRLARRGYLASTLNNGFSYRRHAASTSGTPSRERLAATLEAMHVFVRTLRDEFTDFWNSDLGRAAVAAHLARELSLLTVPVIRATFDRANRDRLTELLRTYDELANGVPASTLVGQPYRPSRLFIGIRRINAAINYLRYHYVDRHRRR